MGCPQTLNGIALDCKGMGGIKNIWIADRADFDSSTVSDGEITAITSDLFDGKAYKCRNEVASMITTPVVDDQAGTLYFETVLEAAFAKMDKTKRLEFVALSKGHLCAMVEDQNGSYWFLGYDNPVVIQEGSGATGQAYADANEYRITLIDKSKEPPYPMSESAVDSAL